jgi:hypothetical protein
MKALIRGKKKRKLRINFNRESQQQKKWKKTKKKQNKLTLNCIYLENVGGFAFSVFWVGF